MDDSTANGSATLYRREGRRFVKVNGKAERFAQPAPKLPRRPIAPSVRDVQRNFVTLVSGILDNSDEAYQQDRSYQRQMRRDPDVMSPLLQRQLAVALLDWDIVAEDVEDEQQRERADALARLVRKNMRRWTDFLRSLMESVWYGGSAANVLYGRVDDGMIAPVDWRPIHPDTLAYTETGELGMYVGRSFEGEKVYGYNGPVHLFDALERRAVVFHPFMPQAPDYEESRDGRYLYAGRGIRDTIWYIWLTKQVALQRWARYIERYAMGTRIARYPAGNDSARDEVEDILANIIGDAAIVFPASTEDDKYDYEVHEPSATNARVFADLIKGYLAGLIKEIIIGQTATTEATNSGLGSEVARRHAETFYRIIRYDSAALADSLNHDFVRELHLMNFGETGYMPRLEFKLEDIDSEKWVAGVRDFVELGGEVPMNAVRSRLGIPAPIEGEDVLAPSASPLDDFGFGRGGLDFARVREDAARFRRALS